MYWVDKDFNRVEMKGNSQVLFSALDSALRPSTKREDEPVLKTSLEQRCNCSLCKIEIVLSFSDTYTKLLSVANMSVFYFWQVVFWLDITQVDPNI